MKSERLKFIFASLFLFIVAVVLFAPALFQGKMLWGGDIQTLEFPFKIAARRSLALHEWPLWMPELLGGMPGIAASNLVFLYPSEFIICMLGLPAHAGFGLDSCLQVFLSGLGMLYFLRRLGLSLEASLLGAFFYAISGTQISLLFAGHINNSKAIAMIPWAFWGLHKGYSEQRWLGWALCGAALALQILGIGMQIFAYTLLGLAAFAAWLAWKDNFKANWMRAVLGLGLAMGFAILLSAPQLWPSLQYKPYSWREGFSYESFTSWSFHPKEALGWIVPGFYGWRQPTYHGDWPFCMTTEYFGLLPWALAFAALAVTYKERKGAVRFLALLALGSFLIGIGKWTPIHHLFYHLPIYSGFRTWTRFLCLLTFAVCCLASFGWDALFSGERRILARKAALGFCAFGLVVALACLGSVDELGRASALRALGICFALALFFWADAVRPYALLALLLALGIHAYDQSEVARRYLEFKDPAQFTQRPDFLQGLPSPESTEPWRLLEAPNVWNQNANIIYGYESLLGYHGVQMAAPMKLQQAMQNRQMDWLNLMNVRYILSASAIPGLPLVRDGGIKIYGNPGALPRAWLVGRTLKVSNDDEAYRLLADPAFNPRAVALLGEEAGPSTAPKGQVTWLARTRNSFRLDVQSSADALLLVSNIWYPAWKARVDGVATPVLKADGALQALRLKAGKHAIEFYFDPSLFYAACGAFLLALLGLFGLWRHEKGRYNLGNAAS